MTDPFAHDHARSDELILVDALDRPIGQDSKERCHREGLLHRAFSVVLVREGVAGPELLLARRAPGKYHSSGLWANSCCSHPRADEQLVDAVERRVPEELGVRAQELHEIARFVYRASFGTGLAEYEYDHVLLGRCQEEPRPDPSEVDATRWVGSEELARELAAHPERFAAWALTVLPLALAALSGRA